jgi:hypothetical protein
MAERATHARSRPRDEALAELTRRYFRSQGPATVGDFVWWSGLLTADAKRGLDIIRACVEGYGRFVGEAASPSVAAPPRSSVKPARSL